MDTSNPVVSSGIRSTKLGIFYRAYLCTQAQQNHFFAETKARLAKRVPVLVRKHIPLVTSM